MRTATVKRRTAETDIDLKLNLDGQGNSTISTGCGFLDHMLTLFAAHGGFDLAVSCKGDTQVDDHHTVEDIGISLGQAFRDCLGEKRGISRYGFFILPMDEALVLASVDFSGRSYLGYELPVPTQKVGSFDTELAEEFWLAFTRKAECSLHLRLLAGKNSHHILEGAFKCAARAMAQAAALDPRRADAIPSTKGVL